MNLIEPPELNSQGENRLSYPIEVPPGRSGLHPQLGVSYNSAGGDGWLGLGRDLPVPAVAGPPAPRPGGFPDAASWRPS